MLPHRTSSSVQSGTARSARIKQSRRSPQKAQPPNAQMEGIFGDLWGEIKNLFGAGRPDFPAPRGYNAPHPGYPGSGYNPGYPPGGRGPGHGSGYTSIHAMPSQDLPGGDNFDWDDPSDWADLVEKIGPTAFCFAYPSRCEGGVEGSPDPSRFPGSDSDGGSDGPGRPGGPSNGPPYDQGNQEAGFRLPGGWGPWAVGGAGALAVLLISQDGDSRKPYGTGPPPPHYFPRGRRSAGAGSSGQSAR